MGAVLLLGLFSGIAEGGTEMADAAATVATEPITTSMTADELAAGLSGRPDQGAFVDAAVAGGIEYLATTNELKQRLIEKSRNRAVCAAVPKSREIERWVGRINRLAVTTQGLGILEVQIGYRTKLSTWNGALSDVFNKTLIPFGSEDYRRLAKMGEGHLITFSGTFFEGRDGACILERSFSLDGGMSTPNFVFRFKDVAEYSGPLT
jgi:hypothetical protein